MTAEHVVVLIGTAADPNALWRAAGAEPLGDFSGTTTVISSATTAEEFGFHLHTIALGTSALDRVSRSLGLTALARRAVRTPLGRLLNSLSPADESRVFSRAVMNDPEARKLIGEASLLVAADAPATRAAWSFLHAGRVPRAVYTLQAARRHLTEAD